MARVTKVRADAVKIWTKLDPAIKAMEGQAKKDRVLPAWSKLPDEVVRKFESSLEQMKTIFTDCKAASNPKTKSPDDLTVTLPEVSQLVTEAAYLFIRKG